jgi:hypothetical protein
MFLHNRPPVVVRVRDAILVFNLPWLEGHLEPNWLLPFLKICTNLLLLNLHPFWTDILNHMNNHQELRALHTQFVWDLVHFDASTDHRQLSQLPYSNAPSGDLHAEVMFMLNWWAETVFVASRSGQLSYNQVH